MCGVSKSKKSQLTGIQYVESEDIEVEVDYNIVYDANENLVNLSAQSVEADYEENLNFSPDMSVEGKFDGTIYLNGQEINIFDIDEENEESIEECAILTGIFLGGIALWKIIAGITVATVAITMVVYPEFYVKGLEKVAEGMETIGKAVIGGMTFILTKATASVISKIKTNTDSKKYDKYYPAYVVNNGNKSEYPKARVGDTMISKYPVKASQARKNFRNGIDCYTYYGTDAKKIIATTYLFSKTYKEIHTGKAMFWHYHSESGYALGRHLHSFYGKPENV